MISRYSAPSESDLAVYLKLKSKRNEKYIQSASCRMGSKKSRWW